MKPKVLAVVGPTAVGKSALAITLAQRFNGEIISGDSMQVYRHLDVGTAKVTAAEQAVVPHHLIDILDVHEQYGVQRFVVDCTRAITEIRTRGKLPIIVGGTGYYLQALFQGLQLGGQASSDPAVRAELAAEQHRLGAQAMWAQLQRVDPTAAENIDPHNERRVLRALEIYRVTGHKPSQQPEAPAPFDSLIIGLNCERQLLYQRINQRVDEMVANGLVAENEWLRDQGPDVPALKGIGYREFIPYFAGTQDLATTVTKIKTDSRHYAKRQLTWFRNQMDVQWYNLVEHPEQQAPLEQAVTKWRQTHDV
ncbi:tRNA (adenosine(37)-N6)-dimethylallyltransferase MiaA [Fructilactobacillus myrtifloralis]|uniref:tRNA dimethylallyltransferase n=1 Tax=Fructilactobacillus myrtifloralis TaxID=2940301 RepID=A0ABY5BNL2_9LACO|nr:tRNA (adenosine(37)-N6)-dimethylallyltransferase MiaA [Fructilactobacillus myrtifloralis]USS85274.1 tRNA (adenosine(37)-N6)-dimethylallyltransferase MiaA [Fructilactobacillus myrtifloralis]